MDELVCRYHGKLLDFAFRHLRNRETAADIAQATLVRVFESASSYRLKASFRTWLYTIALNLIRDEARRRRARPETLLAETEEAGEHTESMWAEYRSPEEIALDRVSADALWRVVGDLPESQKSAVILKFRHGLTYDEIALVMGAPSGTVKSWVHYALKALRVALEPAECGV